MTEQAQRKPCRCAALFAAFGVGAPERCASCVVHARQNELWANGFVQVDVKTLQHFRDCGVPVETIATDHAAWVPCWAEQLRELLFGTWALQPILMRATCDEPFLDALMSVKMLAEQQAGAEAPTRIPPFPAPWPADQPRAHVVDKVTSYARSCGVVITDPPSSI